MGGDGEVDGEDKIGGDGDDEDAGDDDGDEAGCECGCDRVVGGWGGETISDINGRGERWGEGVGGSEGLGKG